MTRGSGGGPPDRVGKAFDAVWGELVGSDEESRDGEASSAEGGTKAWDDEARARTRVDGPSESAPAADAPTASGKTQPASASDIAQQARRLREAETRGQMDWLMTVKPENSGFGKIIDPDADDDDEDDADPLAKTRPDIVPPKLPGGAEVSGTIEAVAPAPATDEAPDADTDTAPSADEPEPAGDAAPDDGTEDRADAKPPAQGRSTRVAISGKAANDGPVAEQAGQRGGRTGLWVAGLAVAAVGGLWAWSQQGDAPAPSPTHAAASTAEPGLSAADPAAAASAGPSVDPTPEPTAKPSSANPRDDGPTHTDVAPPQQPAPDPVPEPEPDPVPSSSDPREPPPGTPPEVAAVFRKLPVSPADGPPVGAVGATGIHIDHISMGARYENRKCTGEAKRFSIANGDRPSVCVRVVHQREKEELVIQWEKKGGATRRGKLHVKPAHAYRTRAYLMLRREYIGDWTVKVLSQEGAELAAYEFTVAP